MTYPYPHTTTNPSADTKPLVAASRPHAAHSKLSLRDALNAFCRQCIYDPKSGLGTWREQVGACTARTCPLYAARPLPRKGV